MTLPTPSAALPSRSPRPAAHLTIRVRRRPPEPPAVPAEPPVLIFQGGGYDGCIWERNALFFLPGTPPRLAPEQPGVSGWAGQRVLAAAREGGLRAALQAARAEGDWHLCADEASWAAFDDEFNKGFVRTVCKLAGRRCRCDRCREWFEPDEIVHLGYRGNGGVGVQFDDNHCVPCAEAMHDADCARHLWKHESLAARVAAIQEHNAGSAQPVSVFAARRGEAPVPYRFYAWRPELY